MPGSIPWSGRAPAVSLVASAVLFASCGTPPDDPRTFGTALGPRIDSLASEALRVGPIAGLSIAVLRDGDLIHARGYGLADVGLASPATEQTVFVIASVSKLITAIAVLTLVEEGLITLDSTLADLLPHFSHVRQADAITVRHLLTHTSGLPDFLSTFNEARQGSGQVLSDMFVLEFLRDRPLDFEIGTHWIYSNTGFYLLGEIIEEVTSTSFGSYIRTMASGLGMNSTYLCDDERSPGQRTIGYTWADDRFEISSSYESPGTTTGFRAAGGLCSSTQDLVYLPTALLSRGALSEASLATMVAPTTLRYGERVDYGLGTRLGDHNGKPLWGHTGGGNGTSWAVLAHYPLDDVTIAVLINTDRTDRDAWIIEGEIARMVLGAGSPEALPEEGLPTFSPYLGEYEGGRTRRHFSIAESGQHLVVVERDADREPIRLQYVGEHSFTFSDAPMDRLVFDVQDGTAMGYSMYYDGFFADFRRRVDR